MATGGSENTSDELFQFNCSLCAKVNRNKEAVSYCVECQGYCCQSCTDTHKLFPATESHKLLDIESDIVDEDVPTQRCSIHTMKTLDKYCQDHAVVGCALCMALYHRTCTHVKAVRNVIDNIFKTSDVENTYKNLQDKEAAMKKMKETKQSCLLRLLASKAEALDAVRDFQKEMECLVKNLEQESIKEVDETFKKIEYTLKDESKKAGNEEAAIQKAVRDLKSSEGNRAQQFVCMKIAQRKIEQISSMSRSVGTLLQSKLTFIANTELRELIRGIKTLGEVCNHSMDILSPKTTLYSLQKSAKLNIRFKDDKCTCNVFDCCFTNDGMVLLADTGNDAFKRVDPFKLIEIDQCALDSSPRSVCSTTKGEAVVSLDSKTIQFVSLGTPMALTNQLNLDHCCHGIASNYDKLFISDDNNSLYIYDKKGNSMQKISHDSITRGKNVSYSEGNDRVFVCDWNKGLITLDAQGKHIHTFSDKDLRNAHGLCTDNRGNIFTCGFNSNNVIQIAEDGMTKVGVVIKHARRCKSAIVCLFRSRTLEADCYTVA